MRKPAFCVCEKDADQLRVCFRYIESTLSRYFQNPKFEASSHLLWLPARFVSDQVGHPEDRFCRDTARGPVVQSMVSLTTSLRRQCVKYMRNTLSNTLLFFVGKM